MKDDNLQYFVGRCVVGMVLCVGMSAPSWAQQGIYTCIDGKGRRLTADRPIAECNDREQRELTSGGLVLRKIGPSLTAEERAAEELKATRALDERNRQIDERKRERALLARYPDRTAHDKERLAALAQVDNVIAAANKHSVDLIANRKKLEQELEFYKANPSKVPFKLKRQVEENNQQMEGQRRFVVNQESEKKRLNTRYDEELVKLNVLWAQLATPTAATTAAAAASAAPKR